MADVEVMSNAALMPDVEVMSDAGIMSASPYPAGFEPPGVQDLLLQASPFLFREVEQTAHGRFNLGVAVGRKVISLRVEERPAQSGDFPLGLLYAAAQTVQCLACF